MALKLYDKLKHTVRYWLLRNLPACQQTVETLSQSMDRPLTLNERLKVKLHLWICVWCQWYLEHLHIIRNTARAKAETAPEAMTTSSLPNEARERIRRRLSNPN